MDLGAYTQIEDLSQIAKDNNIDIPRLRGYRMMKDEKPLSRQEIKEMQTDCEVDVVGELCRKEPFWNPNAFVSSYDSYTDYLTNYYLIKNSEYDGYKKYTGIRWDRIHGWKRKVLKFEIKKKKRRIQEQFDMWNKYAGKENILYIHARIGGNNWDYYGGDELTKQPWFLEKVDDYFDETYCDIYAVIK